MTTRSPRRNMFDVSRIHPRFGCLSQRRSSWRLCKPDIAKDCAAIHQWLAKLGCQYQVSDHYSQVSSGQRSFIGNCERIETQSPHFDSLPNEERRRSEFLSKNCCSLVKIVYWLPSRTDQIHFKNQSLDSKRPRCPWLHKETQVKRSV